METLVLKMHFKLFQAILANIVFLTHTPSLILTLVGGEELSFEEKLMKTMGGGGFQVSIFEKFTLRLVLEWSF